MENTGVSPRAWQVIENAKTWEDVWSPGSHVLQPQALLLSLPFPSLDYLRLVFLLGCHPVLQHPIRGVFAEKRGNVGFESLFLIVVSRWLMRVPCLRRLWNVVRLIDLEKLYSLRVKRLGPLSLITLWVETFMISMFSINGLERRGGKNTHASDFSWVLSGVLNFFP